MDIFGVVRPVFEQYQAESPQKTSDIRVTISKNRPACIAATFLFLKK
jgi:hypothetical protein